MVFGQDANIQCHLINLSQVREDKAIFEARITAGQARNWELVKYWADEDEANIILIFCRTSRVVSKINVLIEISDGEIDRRMDEARSYGFNFYGVKVNQSNAMVYYHL